MNIKPLIAKLLRREELNALERAELEKFDPDALRAQLDELERSKLSREEALQQDLAAAESERDKLRAECGALIRRERIGAIAAASGCSEPEYLDFLALRRGVALDDAGAVKEFIAEAEKSAPHCFRSRLRSGSGGSSSAAPEGGAPASAAEPSDRIGEIVLALNAAPESERL